MSLPRQRAVPTYESNMAGSCHAPHMVHVWPCTRIPHGMAHMRCVQHGMAHTRCVPCGSETRGRRRRLELRSRLGWEISSISRNSRNELVSSHTSSKYPLAGSIIGAGIRVDSWGWDELRPTWYGPYGRVDSWGWDGMAHMRWFHWQGR